LLTLAPTTRIFVGLDPVDLRGGFDRLAGDVRRLGADPLDGQLYLFVNRRRTQLRALWFDRSGWAMYSRRLERGSFELPTAVDGTRKLAIDPAQLAMILEGIDLRAPRRLRYRRPPAGP
jgi:transposase